MDAKPPAQPEIVPFRFAKRNLADVLAVPGVNWKDAVLVLLTWPVGPWGPAAVVGMPTNPFAFTAVTSLTLVLPVIANRVLLLFPWFDVQNGLVPVLDAPDGFTSRGSVMVASPGMLETRLVCAYWALAGRGRPRAAIDSAAALAKRERETMSDDEIEFTFGLQGWFLANPVRCSSGESTQHGADRAVPRDVNTKRKQERSERRGFLFRDCGDSHRGRPVCRGTSQPSMDLRWPACLAAAG